MNCSSATAAWYTRKLVATRKPRGVSSSTGELSRARSRDEIRVTLAESHARRVSIQLLLNVHRPEVRVESTVYDSRHIADESSSGCQCACKRCCRRSVILSSTRRASLKGLPQVALFSSFYSQSSALARIGPFRKFDAPRRKRCNR